MIIRETRKKYTVKELKRRSSNCRIGLKAKRGFIRQEESAERRPEFIDLSRGSRQIGALGEWGILFGELKSGIRRDKFWEVIQLAIRIE